MNSTIWKKWGWRWLCEGAWGAWACIQWQLPLYAGWSRLQSTPQVRFANRMFIWVSAEQSADDFENNWSAELQATACQKQCYVKIFQHFQQLAQCFSPLWFCSFQILCIQTHSWIHLTGQALTVKIKSETSVFEKVPFLSDFETRF